MAVRTKINFYKVDDCGFYTNKQHQFTDLKKLLEDLDSFVNQNGYTLVQTKMFEPTGGEDPLLPVYCMYSKKINQHGDYMIVTWNEIPSNNGQVSSVKPSLKSGAVDVDFSKLPKNNIPGFAAYYWFVPSQNVFAILRFGSRVKNGHQGLKKYLSEYLKNESSFRDLDTSGDEPVVVGYRPNKTAQSRADVEAKFSSSPWRKKVQFEKIKNEREKIFRIIRKGEVRLNDPITRGVWQKMLDVIVGGNSSDSADDLLTRRYRFEMDRRLSEKELKKILEEWGDGDVSDSENVGFVFEKESEKIYWLSDALAKADIKLNLVRDNDEIVNYKSLEDEINIKRQDFLDRLQSD